MRKPKHTILLLTGVVLVTIGMLLFSTWTVDAQQTSRSQEAIVKLQVPPSWFAEVPIAYDTNKPWKEARLEIRRQIALGTQESWRQAIKLTYLYVQKGDCGTGEEYNMYLHLTGEHTWALRELINFVSTHRGNGAQWSYIRLASLYCTFGEYDIARRVLDAALTDLPPAPWKIAGEANVYIAYGDLYAAVGDSEQARKLYQRAIDLLPTSTQPWGKEKIPRQVQLVNDKIDLLNHTNFSAMRLADGTYTGSAPGYAGNIDVTVTVADGKVANLNLKHKEVTDQHATTIIPQRIIDKQSLRVDAISGATVTTDAIVDATYQAIKPAQNKRSVEDVAK